MTAMKRQLDDDYETPTTKRRTGRTKLPSERLATGPSSEAKFTDHVSPATPRVFVKSLPFASYPSGFPYFDCGTIYIILDPRNKSYQYRLHPSTLSNVSTRFALILSTPLRNEVDMTLKIAKTSAGARRLELGYSKTLSTWILRQSAFTTLEDPEVYTTASLPSQIKSEGSTLTLRKETNAKARTNTAVSQQQIVSQDCPMTPDLLQDIPAAEQCLLADQFDVNFASSTFLYEKTVATQRNIRVLSGSSSYDSLIDLYAGEDTNTTRVVAASEKIVHTIGQSDARKAMVKVAKVSADKLAVTAPTQEAALADQTRPSIELCKAYDNLFRIFYNKAPMISTESLPIALQQCELIIGIATRLGALPAIRPYLGNHFGQFGRQLYLSIASEPLRWLLISLKLESAAIFREAVIHLVGRNIEVPKDKDIPDVVYQLLEAKVALLACRKSDVNEMIFLTTLVKEGKALPVIEAIIADPIGWHVVQLFRDFCVQEIHAAYSSGKDALFYRKLATPGHGFMPIRPTLEILIRLNGTDNFNVQEVELDLLALKEYAKGLASKLLTNESMLNVEGVGIDYLTCTKVEDSELPWAMAQ